MFNPSPWSISGLHCTSSVFSANQFNWGQHYYYNYILRTQLQFPQPKLPEKEHRRGQWSTLRGRQGPKLFGFHSSRWAGADMPKHWHYVHAILVWHGTGRHKAAQHGVELGLARALAVAVAVAGMPDPPTRAECSLGHLLLAGERVQWARSWTPSLIRVVEWRKTRIWPDVATLQRR